MKNHQRFGREHECQKKELAIFRNQRIGGDLQVRHDLVDLILRYFIGLGRVNFHQSEVM
jgi:hypothetical protein